MLKVLQWLCGIFIFLFLEIPGTARHIIGGELTYECLGNDQYEVTLKIYRDCYCSNCADFDAQAYIAAFDISGVLLRTLILTPNRSSVPTDISDPCLVAPPDVCVEQGLYRGIVDLPGISGGYNLVYQRCCRNETISNLYNPGSQGFTVVARVPDPSDAECNSSPVFNSFPPPVICNSRPLKYDNSATDKDGDEIQYKLCAPFIGASEQNPMPTPPPPPPYQVVQYSGSFNAAFPINASPAFKVDGNTGLLTGRPLGVGQYVIGVCAYEYRNGKLLSVNKRDFQFNLAECDRIIEAVISNENPYIDLDTVLWCNEFYVQFGNKSVGASTYKWDFGDPSTSSDVSTQKEPSYLYTDTGYYQVTLIAQPSDPCGDTTTMVLAVFPGPEADFKGEDGCERSPLLFQDQSSSEFSSLTGWNWDFGDGEWGSGKITNHVYQNSGTFEVMLTVTAESGCTDEVKKSFTTFPAPYASFSNTKACLEGATYFTNTSTINVGNITGYQWDFGDGGTSNEANPTKVYSNSGDFLVSLVAQSDVGCANRIEKEITVDPAVKAKISGDTTICEGQEIQLTASGGLFFEWKPSYALFKPKSANPTAVPVKNTVFTVIVADSCTVDTIETIVTVLEAPDVIGRGDTTIMVRDSALMRVTGSALSYQWSGDGIIRHPNATQTWVIPDGRDGLFKVVGFGENGCYATDYVRVEIIPICEDVFIPNAFSPNGDGINDQLEIVNGGEVIPKQFQIFNRWGELIHEEKNMLTGWNGTFEGYPQPIGTYIYQFFFTCKGEEFVKTGNITLLR